MKTLSSFENSSTGSDDSAAVELLRRYWGHDSFRPGQWEVIDSTLQKRDVLAVLPTGGGKSVCYQVPALLSPGLSLVISPLIALMRDQVDALTEKRIPAALIDSTLTSREMDQRLTDSKFGKYKLLYVSPERLSSPNFVHRCMDLPVTAVAIDEAHCVSEWGQSFRPSYLRIPDALEKLGRPPVVALTATATPRVQRDIEKLLELVDPVRVVTGFARPNISWSVFRDIDKKKKVLDVLRGVEGSGIVYAGTRREVEEWTGFLMSAGLSAVGYHGGMKASDRRLYQDEWMAGTARVMVATNAFGMGIDKPDVRFIVHVTIPSSIEAYYQEAGRAGRDGRKSYAVLLHNDGDERLQEALIAQSFPEEGDVAKIFETVCSLASIPVGADTDGPFEVDVRRAAEVSGVATGTVRAAVECLGRQGVWTVMSSAADEVYIRILSDVGGLRPLEDGGKSAAIRAVVGGLLRSEFAGRSGSWAASRLSRLAGDLRLDEGDLVRALEYLASVKMIEWKPATTNPRLHLVGARPTRAPVDARVLRHGRRAAKSRLGNLLRYSRSRSCRANYILTYFGQDAAAKCKNCDVCNRRVERPIALREREEIASYVFDVIQQGTPRSGWHMEKMYGSDAVDDALDWLVSSGYVRPSNLLDGTFELTGVQRDKPPQGS